MKAMERAPRMDWPHYLAAFHDLGTHRQLGMSVGPIPYRDIHWYAGEVLDLTEREQQAFVYVIRAVDNDYIARMSARMDKRMKGS